MESRTRPDRNSVTAVRDDIRTSTDEVEDELLTDLLIHSYPQRSSQDDSSGQVRSVVPAERTPPAPAVGGPVERDRPSQVRTPRTARRDPRQPHVDRRPEAGRAVRVVERPARGRARTAPSAPAQPGEQRVGAVVEPAGPAD